MPQVNLDDQTKSPLPTLPTRSAESHKGDYGRALLIGGSRGMSGAIALAGRATLRSGAGLVTLAVPRSIQDIVASLEPSYMTYGLADDDGRIAAPATDDLLEIAGRATAVAIGPGLGRGQALTNFVVLLHNEIDKPMVIDADALFALADCADGILTSAGERVLTPHPGEFARLTGEQPDGSRRVEAAATFAQRDSSNRTVVVLKGHQTVVTDGRRYSINQTGNPGMATGGTGDVLTGIITGLLCQGLAPFDAARLGAHVHGLAGDLAANELGQVGLIASDLIDCLPKAIRAVVS